MHFDWTTFALQLLNFGILVGLMLRFLYRPALRMVDERRASLDAQRQAIEQDKHAAQQARDAAEAERAALQARRESVAADAAREAAAAASRQRAAAQQEAEALIAGARARIERERADARTALQRQAVALATTLAQRLMNDLPATLRAPSWVQRADARWQALSDDEKAAIRHAVASAPPDADVPPVRMVSATPLDAAATADWRRRLAQWLDAEVPVTFAVDTALIDGVEIEFPGLVLRSSWRDAVANLQREALGDEVAG